MKVESWNDWISQKYKESRKKFNGKDVCLDTNREVTEHERCG